MSNNSSLMELVNVEKYFKIKDKNLKILKGINFKIGQGEMNVIMGPSGSGKSTLLNLIGLLDSPTEGEIYLNAFPTNSLNEKERARLRSNTLGFIYQDFNLLPNLDALNNVTLPLLLYKDINKKEREKKARELLDIVGLSHRVNHMPNSLSGGERQRVSIARSLANNPKLILADEPTGNVDEENEHKILDIFKNLSSIGVSLVIVTHNPIYKNYASHLYTMQAGKLEKVGYNNETK